MGNSNGIQPEPAVDLGSMGYAAERALRRRDKAFFAAQRRRPLELAWSAGVSLAGLYVLNWQPASLWAFLLIGQWGGVLRDALKLAFAGEAVKLNHQIKIEDARLWNWVSAARRGQDLDTLQPPAESQWPPRRRLVLDICLLGIATAMIFALAADRDIQLLGELLSDRGLLVLTAGTVLAQVIQPFFSDRSVDPETRKPTMQYDAGGAAIIGWVLMMIFAFLADSDSGLRLSLLVVNGFLIVGIPMAVVSSRLYLDETRWLEDQLAQATTIQEPPFD